MSRGDDDDRGRPRKRRDDDDDAFEERTRPGPGDRDRPRRKRDDDDDFEERRPRRDPDDRADGRPRRRRDRDRDEDDDDDYRRRARRRYRDDDDDGDDDDYYRRKDIGQDAGMRMLLPVGRSLWAIAAGYLGLVSVLCVPAPLAMICGIIALIDIQSDKKKHGLGRAIFGLIMGVIGSIGLAIMIVAFLAKK